MNFALVSHRLARLPHRPVRWLLIGVLLVLATVQNLWLAEPGGNMSAYDQMVKRRLWAPQADASIVVIDIDEASLDKMKGDFGRWPWPRETLADVLGWLETQHSQAVIFDILFADTDVLNKASDEVFVHSVAESKNSYFPVLRLNPVNDKLSQLSADRLPGFARALDSTKQAAPTIAVIPPVFDEIIQTGRMGYHNIYADKDGINRHYRLWEDVDNWRLHSLPVRVAQDLGWPLPAEPGQLIQFTRTSQAYTRIPFSEVWQLSQTQAGQQEDKRFHNAIVLIGSTATSLFDVKVSPLEINHPGVFVLANVLDNLKNQQFLNELSAHARWLMALLMLLLMGVASARLNDTQLRWSVLVVPSLLLGISFISLHTGLNWFVDLAPSASHALLFFSAFSTYQTWRIRQLGRLEPNWSLEDGKDPLTGCHRLVLSMHADAKNFHDVADALHTWPGPASAIALGDVHKLFYLQSGLCHLRLWFSAEQQAQLDTWLQNNQQLWQQHYLITRHDWQHGESMDDIWHDVTRARFQWSSKNENT
jgi:adenylate cyclase